MNSQHQMASLMASIDLRSLLFIFLLAVAVTAFGSPHLVINLDRDWLFHAGDMSDAAAIQVDESQWRRLHLPHDFQIEQPWVAPAADEKADNTDVAANIKSRLSSRGFKEMGRAWYRRHFTPADSLRGHRVLLDFEGIMYVGDVYLNGELIGGTDYGYVGFELDITDRLRWGTDNVIAVMADTRQPNNSRWYTGGGLFRDVKLVVTSADLYFTRHPLFITTRANRYVSIEAEMKFAGREKQATVAVKVISPDGKVVCSTQHEQKRVTPSRNQTARLPEIEIPDPQVWDLDTPRLYTVVAQLLRPDGTVADEVSERFGIRTVEFGPQYGLKLNGHKVLLKGIANHHTLGALGAAAYPRAMEKRIQLLKQFGINHIRTSHNPYSRSFIELCDQNGILVVDELYDKWTRQHTGGRTAFENLWQRDVPEWVKRDRNSPSVLLWSLGNELQQDPNQPFDDFGVTIYKLQKTLIHRYDTTRKVTVAMHPRYRNWQTDSLPCDLAMQTDIQAYNYRYMYFPGDGRRFPWMTFYQSEASVAAMGENFFAMDLDKVIGLAYWGIIDYLGESQGWPTKGWAQGVFDISLEPKPKAWLMKSMFKPDEPMVHIAVIDKKGDQMWNGVQTGNDGMSDHWNRQSGQKLNLITYTNADEVELFVNGKSVGVKQNNKQNPKERNQIRWNDVVYQDGSCEAVAVNYVDNGKGVKRPRIVARHKIETTGPAVRLVAETDNPQWRADGIDLQHVRIYAVDAKGRRACTAQHELTFQLSPAKGKNANPQTDATLVAVSSGNHNSDELNTVPVRCLYNGSALAILRAGMIPGPTDLTITAPGLKPLTLHLTLKP